MNRPTSSAEALRLREKTSGKRLCAADYAPNFHDARWHTLQAAAKFFNLATHTDSPLTMGTGGEIAPFGAEEFGLPGIEKFLRYLSGLAREGLPRSHITVAD